MVSSIFFFLDTKGRAGSSLGVRKLSDERGLFDWFSMCSELQCSFGAILVQWYFAIHTNFSLFFGEALCVSHVRPRSRDISGSSSEKHCDIDGANQAVSRYINL
jgi:hypothetical protein